ncbi:MAG: 4Fe-4S binding protein [candidate division NC10 bacterium]|nr:4Fe-4S binding protein [candidate division NC10 bacterium]
MVSFDFLQQLTERFEQPPAAVTPAACTREMTFLSRCERCLRACPHEAIDLRGKVKVLPACTGCGACLTVCPTDAYRLPESGLGDLLAQVEGAVRATGAAVLTCARSRTVREADAVLPCLARAEETLLLGALAAGAREVTLVRGPCETCENAPAMPRFERTVARLTGWAGAVPATRGLRLVREEEAPARPRPRAVEGERRAFFAWMRREGMQVAARMAEEVAAGWSARPDPSPRGTLSAERRLLLGLLRRFPEGEASLPYDPEGPFADLEVDLDACDGSATCVRVCPTEALTQPEDPDAFTLTFQASRCVNCGLCVEHCEPKAIRFAPTVPLPAIKQGTARVAARKPKAHCASCGLPYIPSRATKESGRCKYCGMPDLFPAVPAAEQADGAPDRAGPADPPRDEASS